MKYYDAKDVTITVDGHPLADELVDAPRRITLKMDSHAEWDVSYATIVGFEGMPRLSAGSSWHPAGSDPNDWGPVWRRERGKRRRRSRGRAYAAARQRVRAVVAQAVEGEHVVHRRTPHGIPTVAVYEAHQLVTERIAVPEMGGFSSGSAAFTRISSIVLPAAT